MLEEMLRPSPGPRLPSPANVAWSIPELLAIEVPLGLGDGGWDPHPAEIAAAALDETEREVRVAEARRIEALLVAYEAAMADIGERFGSRFAGRGGMGARSFLKQTALALGMREGAVGHLLDTALEVRENMPATWAVFRSGRAPWRAVDVAAAQNVGLAMDRMCQYDEVAAHAVQHTPAARLKDRLRRARERLQADTALRRRQIAEADRRVELEPLADGQAALIIRGPAPELLALDGALTRAAVAAHGEEGETRSVGVLRHDILLDVITDGIQQAAAPAANARVPQRKGIVPQLCLTVPVLTLLGHGEAPAILAGYGPIDPERARELAAAAPSFVRILTDPLTGVRLAMDRTVYSPPADLRRWIGVRDEFCRGPGCRRPATLCDIDHSQEWQDHGLTNEENLYSLCRPEHLLKSSGLWKSKPEADGTLTWTSPWGRSFPSEPAEPGDPAPPDLLPPRPTGDAAAEPPEDDCPF